MAIEPEQQDRDINNPTNAPKRPVRRPHLAREIVETLVLTLLIFVVIRFVIQSYHIDGESMMPGLTPNQLVVVNKVAYLFHPPERGDVIVFHNPHNTSEDFIKRVIGLPGDTITCNNTQIWVNGVLLKEPYISMPYNTIAEKWVVPPDHYFVMGDNRPNSLDSRSPEVGMIPKDYIIGKAVMVFWPLNTIHFINTYPDVYKEIKSSHDQPGTQGTPTPTKQATPTGTKQPTATATPKK